MSSGRARATVKRISMREVVAKGETCLWVWVLVGRVWGLSWGWGSDGDLCAAVGAGAAVSVG